MKLKRNHELIVVLLALMFVVTACATMSQKQQATIWMDTYNFQYDDTMSIMTNPSSTEAQKAIGRQKKAILTQVWPLLKIYTDTVNRGSIPDEQTVNDITNLMNQLAALSGGKH